MQCRTAGQITFARHLADAVVAERDDIPVQRVTRLHAAQGIAEEGEFPPDLKRGVLSEDAVYDLITEHIELVTRLQKAVQRCMEIEPDNK